MTAWAKAFYVSRQLNGAYPGLTLTPFLGHGTQMANKLQTHEQPRLAQPEHLQTHTTNLYLGWCLGTCACEHRIK